MKQGIRVLWLALVLVFASGCSGLDEFLQKKELIQPEEFAKDQREQLEKSTDLGPKVSLSQEELKKLRQRRRLNVEERQNYITLSEKKDSSFPVSINLENVGVQDAMAMISEVTGKNVLLGEEVEGRISAELVNVPWDTGLNALLKVKGLANHVDNKANIIRIHKQDVLIAQEDFDRKRIEELQKSIALQKAVEPLYTDLFRLYYTDAATVQQQIQGILGWGAGQTGAATSGSASPTPGGIVIDERINALVVKGTRTELDLISRLISEIDIRTPQVLIEAFIVEATDDFRKELGTRLGMQDSTTFDNGGKNVTVSGLAGGTAGTPTLGTAVGSIAENIALAGATGGVGLLFSSDVRTLKMELSAMESEGLTKILSNPRVFTLNNEQAVIKQGWEIPFSSESQSGGTDIQFKEAMLELTVTPSIVGDGNVILDIRVEKKDVDETVTNPPFQSQEITTKLMVKDDTIVVIGGVKKQKTVGAINKVPYLGDIPFVGNLFRYTLDTDEREELLIFIAPRII